MYSMILFSRGCEGDMWSCNIDIEKVVLVNLKLKDK